LGVVLYVFSLALSVAVEGGQGEFAHLPFTTDPLPFTPMRGFTFEQLVGHLSSLFLATPGLLLIWRAVRAGPEVAALGAAVWKKLALYTGGFSIALSGLVMLLLLRGRPIVDDELAYAFQAQLLVDGKLAFSDIVYPISEVFTVQTALGPTGKYLIGEPLVQTLGVLVGVPALAHLPLSCATLYFVYRAVRLECGVELAALTVALVALSPMYILTVATGMSQCASLFSVALALLGYAELSRDRVKLGAFLVGLGVSFGVFVRIQVAVPVGGVVVLASAVSLAKRRELVGLAVLLAPLLVGATLLGGYNQALTGAWYRLPWYAMERVEHYGFGQVWLDNSYRHTPWTALENLGVVALRLNLWWLGWPSSWLLMWFWFRQGKPFKGPRIWLACGATVLLFEAGYYSTGISDTGAIYHFELLLPLALLGANAIARGSSRAARSTLALLVVQFGLGTAGFLFLQTSRLARLVEDIHSEADMVMAHLPDHSLLFWEPYCSEAVSRGWVHEKFPKRFRRATDRVVTFPRPPLKQLPAYLEHYPDRKCFYFHLNPESHEPQLLPCGAALPYLKRSATRLPAGAMCLSIAPTAAVLGLYDPVESVKKSTLLKQPFEAGKPGGPH